MIDQKNPAPHRIQVKLNTHTGPLDSHTLIHVFHRWIQAQVLDEVAIDVADYSHVPDGPGIMLITHEADYAFDNQYGTGLRYVRKKELPSTLHEAYCQALWQALKACKRLQEAPEFENRIEFDTSSIQVALLDRRLYPNKHETQSRVAQTLSSCLHSVYGIDTPSYTRISVDARYPLMLKTHMDIHPDIESLLERLDVIGRHNIPGEVG